MKFSEILEELRPNTPSLLDPPFYDPEKSTPTQNKIVEDIKNGTNRLIVLGGKGSGKTWIASRVFGQYVKENPGSINLLVGSNESAISRTSQYQLVEALNSVGVKTEIRDKIRIEGQEYHKVIVCKLGEDLYSYVCKATFKTLEESIEGGEFDGVWVDEVQFTTEEHFKLIASRIRGRRATSEIPKPNLMIFTGLFSGDYVYHWTASAGRFGYNIYETATAENIKNLPKDYLKDLKAMYSNEEYQRLVLGKPDAKRSAEFVFDVDNEMVDDREKYRIHRGDEIVISIDFNTFPMCASVWKEYGNKWVQVDEIELFGATTFDLCDVIESKYLGCRGYIIGDATANRTYTSSKESDWDIIEDRLDHQFKIIRGLVKKKSKHGWTRIRKGDITYHNPPVVESVGIANNLLRQRKILFTKSDLPSGGVFLSVKFLRWKPDGRFDNINDKSKNVTATRTHFADTFRYFCYFVETYMNKRTESYKFLSAIQRPRRKGSLIF